MAHLNHRGPEEKGPKTGRLLGICKKTGDDLKKMQKYELGKGMGKARRSGYGQGSGLRKNASDIIR